MNFLISLIICDFQKIPMSSMSRSRGVHELNYILDFISMTLPGELLVSVVTWLWQFEHSILVGWGPKFANAVMEKWQEV